MTDSSFESEIDDVSLLTRAEQREFCLQIIFQRGEDRSMSRVIGYITELALWLQDKPLTPGQLTAFQKIVTRNKLAYHRVSYLSRNRDDLLRCITKTGMYPTAEKKKDAQHKFSRVKDLFLDQFGVDDITGMEIFDQLKHISDRYPFFAIQDAFFKVSQKHQSRTTRGINTAIHKVLAILRDSCKDKRDRLEEERFNEETRRDSGKESEPRSQREQGRTARVRFKKL